MKKCQGASYEQQANYYQCLSDFEVDPEVFEPKEKQVELKCVLFGSLASIELHVNWDSFQHKLFRWKGKQMRKAKKLVTYPCTLPGCIWYPGGTTDVTLYFPENEGRGLPTSVKFVDEVFETLPSFTHSVWSQSTNFVTAQSGCYYGSKARSLDFIKTHKTKTEAKTERVAKKNEEAIRKVEAAQQRRLQQAKKKIRQAIKMDRFHKMAHLFAEPQGGGLFNIGLNKDTKDFITGLKIELLDSFSAMFNTAVTTVDGVRSTIHDAVQDNPLNDCMRSLTLACWIIPVVCLVYYISTRQDLCSHTKTLLSMLTLMLPVALSPLIDYLKDKLDTVVSQSGGLDFGFLRKLIAYGTLLVGMKKFDGGVFDYLVSLLTEGPTMLASASSYSGFISWVISGLEDVVNAIRKMFGKENIYFLKTGEKEVDDWANRLDLLLNSIVMGKVEVDVDTVGAITALKTEALYLSKNYRFKKEVNAVLEKYLRRLDDMCATNAALFAAAKNTRVEPICLSLVGKPGIGKTLLCTVVAAEIITKLTPLEKLKSSDFQVGADIFQKGSSKYDNGYIGQKVYVMDDAFQQVYSEGDQDNDFMRLIRVVNSWMLPLDFADLENKGKNFFRSKFVMITTNLYKLTNAASFVISDPGAVIRRLHHPYELGVSDGWRKSGTQKWDANSLDVEKVTRFQKMYGRIPYEAWVVRKHDFETGNPVDNREVTISSLIDKIVEEINRNKQRHTDMRSMCDNIVQRAILERENQDKLPEIFEPQEGLEYSEFPPPGLDCDVPPGFKPLDDGNVVTETEEEVVVQMAPIFVVEQVEEEQGVVESQANTSHPVLADFLEKNDPHGIYLCENFINEHNVSYNERVRMYFPDSPICDGLLQPKFPEYSATLERLDSPFSMTLLAKKHSDLSFERDDLVAKRLELGCKFDKLKEKYQISDDDVSGFYLPGLNVQEKFMKDQEYMAKSAIRIVKGKTKSFWNYFFPRKMTDPAATTFKKIALELTKGIIAMKVLLKNAILDVVYFLAANPFLNFVLSFSIPFFGYLAVRHLLVSIAKCFFPEKETVEEQAVNFKTLINLNAGAESRVSSQKAIVKNMYRVVVIRDQGYLHLGNVTGIVGKIFCVPTHFFRTITTEKASGVLSNKNKVVFINVRNNTLQFEIDLPVFEGVEKFTIPDTDCTFCEFKVNVAASDISKKFLTQNEVKTFNTFKCMFASSTQEVNNVSLTWAYSQADRMKSTLFVGSDTKNPSYSVKQTFKYAIPTAGGDCGGLLMIGPDVRDMSNGAKVVGFHTGANVSLGIGYSTIITREMVEDALKHFKSVIEEEVADKNVVGQAGSCTEGTFVPLYEVEKGIQAAPYSKLCKTDLFGMWGENMKYPTPLGHHVVDEVLVKPLEVATKKYGGKVLVYDQNEIKEAAHVAFEPLTRCSSRVPKEDRVVLSFEHAVIGEPGNPMMNAIPRNTSAGYPRSLEKGVVGKKDFFGFGEDYDLESPNAQVLKKDVEDIIDNAKKGVRKLHVFTDFLKDERRPKTKGARLVSGAPVAYVVAFRMYFLKFISTMMEDRISNGCCAGINVYQEWKYLWDHLTTISTTGIAGDYTAFDSSEQPQIHDEILNFINNWYDDGDENARVRTVLWLELTHSRHLGGDGKVNKTIYQWFHSLPSGHPATTIVNSMYNLLLFALCYRRIMGPHRLVDYHKLVRPVVLGDDNVVAIAPIIQGEFNQDTITKVMKDFGMTYTAEDKDSTVAPIRELRTVGFLKRGFHFEELNGETIVVGNLSLDTIREMPYWCRNKADMLEICKTNFETALMELSAHGQEVWDEKAPAMLNAYKASGRITNLYPSREMYLALFRQCETRY